MLYNEKVEALVNEISELEYVQKFKKAEQNLHAKTELFDLQTQMKDLQRDAVLYRKIGKMQAYKETSHAAQKIEKQLKKDPLVQQYFLMLQDVNDLVQYVTGEIEGKVNASLEDDE